MSAGRHNFSRVARVEQSAKNRALLCTLIRGRKSQKCYSTEEMNYLNRHPPVNMQYQLMFRATLITAPVHDGLVRKCPSPS